MKIVYLAHPIGAYGTTTVQDNLASLRRIIRQINLEEPDTVPFAPYYTDVVSLDDSVPEERARGMKNGAEILRRGFYDELWICSTRISSGMEAEIAAAREAEMPVRHYLLPWGLDPERYKPLTAEDMIAGTTIVKPWKLKHPSKIDLEDQANDWALKNQIEARTEASRGPRATIQVQTDTSLQPRWKVPRWLVKALRYIFFLPLALAAWAITVGYIAGEGGTSVAGRVVGAFFGLVFLLIITAYIFEFNQKHDKP